MAKGIIRLVRTINADSTQSIAFDFAADLVGDEVISNPVVDVETIVGDAALTFSSPVLNATEPEGSQHRVNTRASTYITCPANAKGGKWHVNCKVTTGTAPLSKYVSAEVVQNQ